MQKLKNFVLIVILMSGAMYFQSTEWHNGQWIYKSAAAQNPGDQSEPSEPTDESDKPSDDTKDEDELPDSALISIIYNLHLMIETALNYLERNPPSTYELFTENSDGIQTKLDSALLFIGNLSTETLKGIFTPTQMTLQERLDKIKQIREAVNNFIVNDLIAEADGIREEILEILAIERGVDPVDPSATPVNVEDRKETLRTRSNDFASRMANLQYNGKFSETDLLQVEKDEVESIKARAAHYQTVISRLFPTSN